MKKCTREELDAYVAGWVEVLVDDKHIDGGSAEEILSVIIDLDWPDIPVGFSTEEFIDSWNRQMEQKEKMK